MYLLALQLHFVFVMHWAMSAFLLNYNKVKKIEKLGNYIMRYNCDHSDYKSFILALLTSTHCPETGARLMYARLFMRGPCGHETVPSQYIAGTNYETILIC